MNSRSDSFGGSGGSGGGFRVGNGSAGPGVFPTTEGAAGSLPYFTPSV